VPLLAEADVGHRVACGRKEPARSCPCSRTQAQAVERCGRMRSSTARATTRYAGELRRQPRAPCSHRRRLHACCRCAWYAEELQQTTSSRDEEPHRLAPASIPHAGSRWRSASPRAAHQTTSKEEAANPHLDTARGSATRVPTRCVSGSHAGVRRHALHRAQR
jgi:hypothetical protein